MKICSRCNKELRKTDLVCPRCGASTVRDIYGRRVTNFNTQRNYHSKSINTKINTKNNPKAAIVATIICFIIPLCISFMLEITEVATNKNSSKLHIENYTSGIVRYNEDMLDMLEEFEDEEIGDSNYIKEAISSDDEVGASCLLYDLYPEEGNLISCVKELNYSNRMNINDDMDEFYTMIYRMNDSPLKTLLTEIYGVAYDMYYLPDNYVSLEDYQDAYEELKDEYDSLIETYEKEY